MNSNRRKGARPASILANENRAPFIPADRRRQPGVTESKLRYDFFAELVISTLYPLAVTGGIIHFRNGAPS